MKKLSSIVFTLIIFSVFLSCASLGNKSDNNFFVTFVDNNRDFDYSNVTIVIDGTKSGSFNNGETRGFKLNPDVAHRIYFDYTRQYRDKDSARVNFSTPVYEIILENNKNYYRTFLFYMENDSNYYSFNETKVEPKLTLSTGTMAKGIEAAAIEAAQKLISDLPENSTLAVISIASDRETAGFVIDELEYHLVNSRRFRTVDRNAINAIRQERNFQLSGDVSDESAVSIGEMLGANVVITGTITGSGNMQRLTIKALDVKTAEILTMARVPVNG